MPITLDLLFRILTGRDERNRRLKPGEDLEKQITVFTNELFDLYDKKATKLEFSFTLLLKHNVTGQLMFKHAGYFHHRYFTHTEPFKAPVLFNSLDDRQAVIDEIPNITEHLFRQRPDTQWQLLSVTSVMAYVFKQVQHYFEFKLSLSHPVTLHKPSVHMSLL